MVRADGENESSGANKELGIQASERSPLLPTTGPSPAHNDDDPVTNKISSTSRCNSRLGGACIFLWTLVATATFIVIAVWTQHSQQTSNEDFRSVKRNLVFMVSDGMGPASLSLTRSFRQHVDGLAEDSSLVLDKHFWGSSRTRSSNSLVTDSAAGATAFSCGRKSYNGAISMLPDLQPCGSVLEAAKRAGYMTGLVVTTDITDATPACFASHVQLRQLQDEIALQEVGHGVLGRSVDLMLGGGRCHFLPNTTSESCRMDELDVTMLAQDKYGWTYANSREEFDALKGGDNVSIPLLGLFASADIPFELDRKHMGDTYPSLSEMAKTAMRALERATANSDKGFFLMIEGSRIDHAGHINDPAAQVHEVLEYDKTFKAVIDFIGQSKTKGVLVATSDHETGGLATALQEPGHLPVYNWYPQVLANVSASCERLAAKLRRFVDKSPPSLSEADLKSWINSELVVPGLGISDATDDELTRLANDPDASVNTFAAILSLRSHIGWSTHGHTAVDVNIYSSGGPETEKIRGNVENTDVGKFLGHYLDVNVDEITEELREKMDKGSVTALDATSLEWGNGYHVAESMREWRVRLT
ncbi:repressible alkaline phosphatase precursor [Drechmeria coniospora]|uniref:Alkaline phosphatase n=1 Tax=Drechmeria coniospora TaxID=98403 RepID=A0A151GI60_DRECN|nr:repressible alkaline phosphatase precursor [Drechmeria coniospora]KYK56731.1 repressible alkaline phosphatase precursor [Drechmeria coniospora]